MESVYAESTVARILKLVESASKRRRAPRNSSHGSPNITRPASFSARCLLALLPPLAGLGAWNVWIERALIFLVISSVRAGHLGAADLFGGSAGFARGHSD
ncbi:MAG: hypothetical protein ACLUFV_03540 [Acutalibacteraceae bacterium]